ncbi:hypothetical protein MATL_G00074970 [Megalops atlanticus]|uniref:Opioid growth factor receptor (OGFr) conserved domain-containing protein n=1 Tax=Megalops atlanticus TaxID=7932 RepID=A0A9D3Q9K2_MEGAT|nr:hypothetical protein MATL_G00074970 [Megalops atlanticus]
MTVYPQFLNLVRLIQTLFCFTVSLALVCIRTIMNFWVSTDRCEDEDDLVCEYDSTWDMEDTESDSDEDNSTGRTTVCGGGLTRFFSKTVAKDTYHYGYSWRRNTQAAKDMQNYRRGYPDEARYRQYLGMAEEEENMANLQFYLNKKRSEPDGVYIDEFHQDWNGHYEKLERVHSYIQWLFPLQEPGMNYMAQELTMMEIEAFCNNEKAKQRLLTSYKMMLDFYGITLVNKETGEVKRSANWEKRFENLNRYTHNNLRITRILKCLGELGFPHYQAPLVQFFLEETLVHKNLDRVKQSVLDYFLFAVRDKEQRRKLIEFAFEHYQRNDEFVWKYPGVRG